MMQAKILIAKSCSCFDPNPFLPQQNMSQRNLTSMATWPNEDLIDDIDDNDQLSHAKLHERWRRLKEWKEEEEHLACEQAEHKARERAEWEAREVAEKAAEEAREWES